MTAEEALDRGLRELGFALPEGAREKLLAYLALVEKWNRTYNLSAIRDRLAMVSRHLLDSLAVVPHLPLPAENASLADVGSGAGLPGIPIAIAQPRWAVTLNDASQKKSAFLRQAAMELGLANVHVHEGRVEAWRPTRRFSLVISRAFAALSEFIVAARHLVAPGGALAAMIGREAVIGAGCEAIALHVPLLRAERHLVLCRFD